MTPPWLAWVEPVSTALYALATFALLVVTIVNVRLVRRYTETTKRMVKEMERARAAQIMPRLVPVLHVRRLDYQDGWPQIRNVGPGPALHLDTELSLEPGGPRWPWKPTLMTPGERKDFTVLKEGTVDRPKEFYELDEMVEKYPTLRLKGSCRDALGQLIAVDETVDIRAYWTMRKSARALKYTRDNPAADVVQRLEQIRDALQAIANKVTGRQW